MTRQRDKEQAVIEDTKQEPGHLQDNRSVILLRSALVGAYRRVLLTTPLNIFSVRCSASAAFCRSCSALR